MQNIKISKSVLDKKAKQMLDRDDKKILNSSDEDNLEKIKELKSKGAPIDLINSIVNIKERILNRSKEKTLEELEKHKKSFGYYVEDFFNYMLTFSCLKEEFLTVGGIQANNLAFLFYYFNDCEIVEQDVPIRFENEKIYFSDQLFNVLSNEEITPQLVSNFIEQCYLFFEKNINKEKYIELNRKLLEDTNKFSIDINEVKNLNIDNFSNERRIKTLISVMKYVKEHCTNIHNNFENTRPDSEKKKFLINDASKIMKYDNAINTSFIFAHFFESYEFAYCFRNIFSLKSAIVMNVDENHCLRACLTKSRLVVNFIMDKI